MSSQTQSVYLITGANRGIGRAIVAILLQRADSTVIAAVRDPADPTSASLSALERSDTSILHTIQLSDVSDYAALSGTLANIRVTHLDTVIANAGHSVGFRDILNTTPEDIVADHENNVLTAVRLVKATWPLLEQGDKKEKKFVLMTSSVGSIGCLEQENFPSTSYGMSKAAVNWFGKKLHVEFKDRGLLTCVLHPGWVKTSMGSRLAQSVGASPDAPPSTAEASAADCIKTIDALDASTSGKFLWAGHLEELPW